MRTFQHPWDWIGHFVWFALMQFFMSPTWAVCSCAFLLEVDQAMTWGLSKRRILDTIIDLVSNALGIIFAIWLKSLIH